MSLFVIGWSVWRFERIVVDSPPHTHPSRRLPCHSFFFHFLVEGGGLIREWSISEAQGEKVTP